MAWQDAELYRRLTNEFGNKFEDHRQEVAALFRSGFGYLNRPAGASSIGVYVLHHSGGGRPGGQNVSDLWRYARDRAPYWGPDGRIHYGWNTGNYAVCVQPNGVIQYAAQPSYMTYHVGDKWNPAAFAVCAPGNYRDYKPSRDLLDSIYRVFLVLDRIGYRPWRGHKELAATACPGQLLPHLKLMRGAKYGAANNPPRHYP